MGLISAPDHFDRSLRSAPGGTPGAVLESFSVDNAMGSFGNFNPPILVNSTVQPLLTAGTPYWLIAATTGDTVAAWNWNSIGDTGPHASSTNGGAFTVGTDTRGAFRVTVGTAAVPEPSTLALTGLGMLGMAAWLRRRKKARGKDANGQHCTTVRERPTR